MRILKWLLAVVVLLVLAVVAGAYLLPERAQVSRSIVIKASPEAVFAQVNDLHQFAEWSPWSGIDPAMTMRFEGPEAGVGQKMVWSSEHQEVGNGSQEITASSENQRVETMLDFGEMGTATAAFVLEPVDDGTRVTWAFETALGNSPIKRWMGLMMDRWVGDMYDQGLATLKQRVEAGS